ncbi:Thiopurine S-methyltransferase [Pseudomonas sp. 8Z]|uniref:thiopurine S-methyltransferase n=1 Tax=Pseudomonas sp. 8Z TaxID=2653166 RepID=UPI0012F14EC2|nr:thiopurine S-methyltransferase [Pseudomonas sp. 8Z]VXD02123.1 Thiopurine S-methyltransferase [Pseudomonas sp. 8Z]
MHEAFWQERWAREQIGFHQDQVNAYLLRHWSMLGISQGQQVLVPLCGKSLDLAWLARQGHAVLGVELAEKAVQAFFHEQRLQPQVRENGAFRVYTAGAFALWCGDFFALSAEDVAGCQAFYDRAALIALPVAMRERYAAHLRSILPASCQGLLITLQYDQSKMDGPPFSVSDVEVRERFSQGWKVCEVQREDVLAGEWKFIRHDLRALDEVVYHLRSE